MIKAEDALLFDSLIVKEASL